MTYVYLEIAICFLLVFSKGFTQIFEISDFELKFLYVTSLLGVS